MMLCCNLSHCCQLVLSAIIVYEVSTPMFVSIKHCFWGNVRNSSCQAAGCNNWNPPCSGGYTILSQWSQLTAILVATMWWGYKWMSVSTSLEMKWVPQVWDLNSNVLFSKWSVDFDVKLLCSLALCPIWVLFSISRLLMLRSNFRCVFGSQ
jgi:hypothetical protein